MIGILIVIIIILIILIIVFVKKYNDVKEKELKEKARKGATKDNMELFRHWGYYDEQKITDWIYKALKSEHRAQVSLALAKFYIGRNSYTDAKNWLNKTRQLDARLEAAIFEEEGKIEAAIQAEKQKELDAAKKLGTTAVVAIYIKHRLELFGYTLKHQGSDDMGFWDVYKNGTKLGVISRINSSGSASAAFSVASMSKYELDMKNIYAKAKGLGVLALKFADLPLIIYSEVETPLNNPPEWMVTAADVIAELAPNTLENDPYFMEDGGDYYTNTWLRHVWGRGGTHAQ